MKSALFNFFYDEKHHVILIVISDFRGALGGFDLYERISFIILAGILSNLFLFIYNYIFYRIGLLYVYTKRKIPFLKKIRPNFDIYGNRGKFASEKKFIYDRPRCKYSIKGQKDINYIYTTNNTIITKSAYL